ncbi:hypothetical protein M0811_03653 [Anaeramoeba ignava]|uniref:Uncharacterized protein n=1 Tax=Anaeramoeba ignava TaxID=1746090 RepID=A0A9Q0L5Y1_ANAIG|nr:hypothetical protein M0811_03653 [Anaeramoeba ignava]
MFSMMNMENMFYLIHEKMLRNLFSIIKENQEYQQELLEFIDKKMSEKNLKIIRTNPENAILYSCVKVINEDEKLQKIIILNNNNNKQLLSKENKPINIIVAYIQDGFPLSKIIKFIRKRRQCLNKPKKFTSRFKNSLSKKTGQEWLKFIFNEIEKSKGRLQLIHFIQNEIPEKKEKETSLLYYYEKQMGNDLSTQFQKSHVSFPSEYNKVIFFKIYSHFWNIENNLKAKKIYIKKNEPNYFQNIRLLMHLSIISVSIISDKFSNFSFSLSIICVLNRKAKEELIQQLFGHIQNDLTILSKLINTQLIEQFIISMKH